MPTIELMALALGCYLWGSLSPAQCAALRVGHADLTRLGSGSVGGSNVGEQLGLNWLIAVGIADVLKGMLPVVACRIAASDPVPAVLAGIAAVAGHNWSVYLDFRGGRGIAATLGAVTAWDWRLAALFLAMLAAGRALRRAPEATIAAILLLTPASLAAGIGNATAMGCASLGALAIAKRLEANRIPLPRDGAARRTVLLRRLLMDRDVPRDEPWQERKLIS